MNAKLQVIGITINCVISYVRAFVCSVCGIRVHADSTIHVIQCTAKSKNVVL